MKTYLFLIFLITNFFFTLEAQSKSNYFFEGKKYFEKKNYEKSKFLFQKDIVFNPKESSSYLYLAKIFKIEENEEEEEKNLNTVLVLTPKNEEAINMLIKLKISQSDFTKAQELLETFNLVCNNLCHKTKQFQKDLDNSLAQ